MSDGAEIKKYLAVINKNITILSKGMKRRHAEVAGTLEHQLPQLVTGKASVTAANFDAFMSTAFEFMAQNEAVARRIAIRRLEALLAHEYKNKTVKRHRRIGETTVKKIICDELRADDLLCHRVRDKTDRQLVAYYNKYLATKANNDLANFKKNRDTLQAAYVETKAIFAVRNVTFKFIPKYTAKLSEWSQTVTTQAISDDGTSATQSLASLSLSLSQPFFSQTEVEEEEEIEQLSFEEQ